MPVLGITVRAETLVVLAVFGAVQSTFAATDCPAIEAMATRNGAHILGHQSGRIAVGKGRVQFFSAPDYDCKMDGAFVVAGDKLDAYLDYNGFTSVLFFDKAGEMVLGWVESSRLKSAGTGFAPDYERLRKERE